MKARRHIFFLLWVQHSAECRFRAWWAPPSSTALLAGQATCFLLVLLHAHPYFKTSCMLLAVVVDHGKQSPRLASTRSQCNKNRPYYTRTTPEQRRQVSFWERAPQLMQELEKAPTIQQQDTGNDGSSSWTSSTSPTTHSSSRSQKENATVSWGLSQTPRAQTNSAQVAEELKQIEIRTFQRFCPTRLGISRNQRRKVCP
jgi:hypothetical protein